MDTLFRHVHDATRRTLEANGYRWSKPQGQACCGALHEHAGDRAAAEALARANVAALRGRGGLRRGQQRRLRRAAQGLRPPARHRGRGRARRQGARRLRAPRRGGARGRAAPCRSTWRTTRRATCSTPSACRRRRSRCSAAIPALRLRLLPSSDKCCGSAGIYSVVRPAMARAVLDLKLESFAAAEPGARDRGDRKPRVPDADRRRRPRGGAGDPGGASGGAAGRELSGGWGVRRRRAGGRRAGGQAGSPSVGLPDRPDRPTA